jgi:MFS superfamily sulfate permease-like transporter
MNPVVRTTSTSVAPSPAASPELRQSLGADLRAGVIVFFVALPLCLGIATASGAPPLSGLIAGFVGGTVVALSSKSSLSVAGPAAGLTVIVLDAIQRLGFRAFLLATVLAGVIQIVLGASGLGRLGQLVPNAVIRGMLAAIGLILILKQLPHAVGHDTDHEGDFSFHQLDGHNTFSEIFYAASGASLSAVFVAVLAGLAMYFWRDYGRVRLARFVPRELLAVAVGLGCAMLFVGTSFEFSGEHRVSIPLLSEVSGLTALWVAPDFGAIANPAVWKTAVTIAIVASIESLLSVEATDRLDPYRRVTPPNRELVAQGAGNMVSGLLGGLPVTAVVVRSFANVNAGGRTRMASVFHGVLLLAATLGLAALLNNIPLAALAVILLVVGYKLTPPKLYKEMFRMGRDQFVPFIATVGFIIFTDLLTGTLLGIGFAFFFMVYAHYLSAVVVTDDGNVRLIRFVANVSFLHKARIKDAMTSMPSGSEIVLDGASAISVDADVIETIRDFQSQAADRGVTLSIRRSPTARHRYFRQEERATT